MISTTIDQEIKQAMLAKDAAKLRGLRAIKAALLLAKTEKGHTEEIDADAEIKILQRLVKQRKESAQMYLDANRPELAEDELAQCKVIEKYLPAMLSEAELTEVLTAIIQQVGAQGPQDMGKVMGVATKQLAGKAEGKAINLKVRELLSK